MKHALAFLTQIPRYMQNLLNVQTIAVVCAQANIVAQMKSREQRIKNIASNDATNTTMAPMKQINNIAMIKENFAAEVAIIDIVVVLPKSF